MDAGGLLAEFRTIADAPGGVGRLRELILRLAVHGRLLPQNPRDAPVLSLLRQFDTAGARKKNTHERPRIGGSEELVPVVPLPSSWEWVRLADIGEVVGGGTPRSGDQANFSDHGIAWLTPADMKLRRGKYLSRGRRDITEKGLGCSAARLVPAGTVLFTSRAPVGNTAIALDEVATNQGFKSCVPIVADMSEYIYIFLTYAGPLIDSRATGTTFREVSGRQMATVPFPLAPLAEQRRIVAKVDELMAMCDELEGRQERRRTVRRAAQTSALEALSSADSPESLAHAWNRVRANWEALTAHPDSIPPLRQAILQLAVQGKLVAQDPRDEPAATLLGRLRSRPTTARGGTSPHKSTTVEPLYQLPATWAWCRFDQVAAIRSNLVTPGDFPNSPHIAPNHIEKGTGRLLHYGTVAEDGVSSSKHRFFPGQILYSKIRPNLAKAVLVDFDGLCSADMYPLDPYIDSIYLWRYMLSGVLLQQVLKGDNRLAMPKVNQQQLNQVAVPVPPLAEQRRIVAKVDELMALCGELESRLQSQEITSTHLAAAVVHAIAS